MKKAAFLFVIGTLAFSCSDEDSKPILNDGEYVLSFFNKQGDLLLTKRGAAHTIGRYDGYWEIRLLDEDFAKPNADPTKTFAGLLFFSQTPVLMPQEVKLNDDRYAYLYQRWYSAPDDWGYRSESGTLGITYVNADKIRGSIDLILNVDANTNLNSAWGDKIIVKGYFASACPYDDNHCP